MDLNALADFLAVADSGGISAAARLRKVPKQTLSRRLQRLEGDLGVRLFDRSSRVLRLTDEGRLLRDRVAPALSALDDAQRELGDRAEAPRGR
ncbi:MAG: LysR family transcriptional regulator, partial [Xanthomonadales bacterium]|nr:LysR family transcriptional regulator [Xanthomonadales bacterium]